MKRNPVSQLRRRLRELDIWHPGVGSWVCIPRTHWWRVFVAWRSCSDAEGRDGSIPGSSWAGQPGVRNSLKQGRGWGLAVEDVANSYPCTHTHTHVHAHICACIVQVHREHLALLQQRLLCCNSFCVSRHDLTISRNPGWLWTQIPLPPSSKCWDCRHANHAQLGAVLLKPGLARLASNSWSPCFSLPCAGITGKATWWFFVTIYTSLDFWLFFVNFLSTMKKSWHFITAALNSLFYMGPWQWHFCS